MDPYARLWWLLALRGLAGLTLAVLSIVWPFLTLEALLYGFGLYAAADGALALYAGVRSWPFALEGAAGILLGAAIFAFPDGMAFVLWYLVAGWALATGVCELAAAAQLRRAHAGEMLLATAGVASVAFGVIMLAWPRAAMITLSWLVGYYAALFGFLLVALALRLRRAGSAPRSRGRIVTARAS